MIGDVNVLIIILVIITFGLILFRSSAILKVLVELSNKEIHMEETLPCEIIQLDHRYDKEDSPKKKSGNTGEFYGVFLLSNGESIELKMSPKDYISLCKGKKGNLTYKGDRFIGFKEDDKVKKYIDFDYSLYKNKNL